MRGKERERETEEEREGEKGRARTQRSRAHHQGERLAGGILQGESKVRRGDKYPTSPCSLPSPDGDSSEWLSSLGAGVGGTQLQRRDGVGLGELKPPCPTLSGGVPGVPSLWCLLWAQGSQPLALTVVGKQFEASASLAWPTDCARAAHAGRLRWEQLGNAEPWDPACCSRGCAGQRQAPAVVDAPDSPCVDAWVSYPGDRSWK